MSKTWKFKEIIVRQEYRSSKGEREREKQRKRGREREKLYLYITNLEERAPIGNQ